MIFDVIILKVKKYIMKPKFFYTSPEEFIFGPYTPAQIGRPKPHPFSEEEVEKRAKWFPAILHAIPVGNFNLFQVVSGSPNELGPNQTKLKEWILEQARKHEPLKFPIFLEIDENISKEDLAGKILDHLFYGSSDMIFLPTLPVNPHIKQDHKKESSWLFKLHRIPRILPTALA